MQKSFKINYKLTSMTGRINLDVKDLFLDFIKENDCDITQLSKS